jgi:hypothetical protein
MGFAIGSARWADPWALPILQICVLESIVYFWLIAGISPILIMTMSPIALPNLR